MGKFYLFKFNWKYAILILFTEKLSMEVIVDLLNESISVIKPVLYFEIFNRFQS